MKNLLKSLAEFQNEVPVIHEETKGYNYTFANLNTIFKVIKPLLKSSMLGLITDKDIDACGTPEPIIKSKNAFTELNFKKAKEAKASIELIKKNYSLTPEMETKYMKYVG